jgi:hypothetical protein
VTFSNAAPQCRSVEIEYCEFTDNHDGLSLGTIDGLKFHHNVVENFDDDGLYVTLARSSPPHAVAASSRRRVRRDDDAERPQPRRPPGQRPWQPDVGPDLLLSQHDDRA